MWKGGRCDHSIDIQPAVVGSRAAICASLGEGSQLRGVWTRMLLVYEVVTSEHPRVRVACWGFSGYRGCCYCKQEWHGCSLGFRGACCSDDRGMETVEVRVTWSGGCRR